MDTYKYNFIQVFSPFSGSKKLISSGLVTIETDLYKSRFFLVGPGSLSSLSKSLRDTLHMLFSAATEFPGGYMYLVSFSGMTGTML